MCNTNNPINNVRDHRKYWDGFVNQWKQSKNSNAILCWADPDSNPKLLNDPSNNNDHSSLYLPEPWWGNDGIDPLHSVVINFNPGEGGCCQTKSAMQSVGCYSKCVVKGNKLAKTEKWHLSNRAAPIQRSMGIKESLDNHLSVELIPWHTKKVTKDYWTYLENNIVQVYKHSIIFAAEESKHIQNACLKNVVIIRMNGDNTKKLLTVLKERLKVGVCMDYVMCEKDGKYLKFKVSDSNNPWINDVTFVSIWGPRSRNNFPKQGLPLILKQICQDKIVKCNNSSGIE